MTTLGSLILFLAAVLLGGWILDLVRRGRLYVGYGIVLLALVVLVTAFAVVPILRAFALALLLSLYPSEPVAVIGLAAVLLLLVYLLHQISVLSDRVATLTQELAIKRSGGREHVEPPVSLK
ncbi:MAG: DUF2304 family protein [Vicinamibacteria bacterium]